MDEAEVFLCLVCTSTYPNVLDETDGQNIIVAPTIPHGTDGWTGDTNKRYEQNEIKKKIK